MNVLCLCILVYQALSLKTEADKKQDAKAQSSAQSTIKDFLTVLNFLCNILKLKSY